MGDNKVKFTGLQMREEQLKAFWEAIQADARLQQKLQNVTDPGVGVEIAKAAGFMISADQFEKVQSDLTGDLTEEEGDDQSQAQCFFAQLRVDGPLRDRALQCEDCDSMADLHRSLDY